MNALYFLYAIGAISFATFLLYGIDKLKAKQGAYRISERVLLIFSFFGGAIGALFGMLLFRHKTRHFYFFLVAILGIAWQSLLFVFLFL